MRKISTKIGFKPDYVKLSKVQFKQNQKFLKFFITYLKTETI